MGTWCFAGTARVPSAGLYNKQEFLSRCGPVFPLIPVRELGVCGRGRRTGGCLVGNSQTLMLLLDSAALPSVILLGRERHGPALASSSLFCSSCDHPKNGITGLLWAEPTIFFCISVNLVTFAMAEDEFLLSYKVEGDGRGGDRAVAMLA